MKTVFLVFTRTSLTGLAMACGSSTPGGPTAPTTATTTTTTSPGSLAGMWNGMGNDSQGSTLVTWALTQTGNTVSGTVKTQAVDPNDGSCGSCHRN